MLAARSTQPLGRCTKLKSAVAALRVSSVQLSRAARRFATGLRLTGGVRVTTANAMASDARFRNEPELTPVYLRELQKGQAAVHLFRVKGVSFEGRQAVLAQLKEGAAVMLTREPENQFDEHAIAVKLLDGRRLGFVPRDINRSPFFPHVVSFGHIRSLGVAEAAGLYGVQVEHQPSLLPFTAEAIPDNLQAKCEAVARTVQADARLYRDRCTLTGSAAERPVVQPRWEADNLAHAISLAGVHCLAPQLSRAQSLLLNKGHLDLEAALVFRAMNGWTSDELDQYREHQQNLVRERSDGTWTLALN